MSTVNIDGITYIITKEATTDISESFVAGRTEPLITVSGQGYREDDADQTLVEIVWYVDNPNAQDGADLVNDWETADEANEI